MQAPQPMQASWSTIGIFIGRLPLKAVLTVSYLYKSILTSAANRTNPGIGDLFEGRTRRNPVLRITRGRIINPITNGAFPFIHANLLKKYKNLFMQGSYYDGLDTSIAYASSHQGLAFCHYYHLWIPDGSIFWPKCSKDGNSDTFCSSVHPFSKTKCAQSHNHASDE